VKLFGLKKKYQRKNSANPGEYLELVSVQPGEVSLLTNPGCPSMAVGLGVLVISVLDQEFLVIGEVVAKSFFVESSGVFVVEVVKGKKLAQCSHSFLLMVVEVV